MDIEKNLGTLADRINAAHDRCEEAVNAALEHALDAGEMLLEVKAALPHGAFGPWLAENFEGSDRTARSYMRVAKHHDALEAKRQSSASLSLGGALKALAAPSGSDDETSGETSVTRLQELEQQLAGVIEQGPAPGSRTTGLTAIGRILLTVENEGLYRAAGYAAFSRYCGERLGLQRRFRDVAILHAELVEAIPAFDADEKLVHIPEGTSYETHIRAWKIMDAIEEAI